MNPTEIQIDYFRHLFQTLNYKFFEEGSYNLNLIAIRHQESDNTFNDIMYVVFKDYQMRWKVYQFTITTKAGAYYLLNPMNSDGTAIVVPGQYSKAYKLGIHKNYPALVQSAPIRVYRDKNKDTTHDLIPSTIEKGVFSINIHRSSATGTSTKVDKWSAGCMVFSNILEWNLFYATLLESQKLYGDFFTFTLIEESQLK